MKGFNLNLVSKRNGNLSVAQGMTNLNRGSHGRRPVILKFTLMRLSYFFLYSSD